ncbi:hemerythrin domain-containing protein [Litoribacter ruber]|uniref:Hemerythrin domain-containing protein n=1 Tax=Litoribacter ruber TaxID=702568 RepID=A0AAP2CIV4_9BACT|nr:MULTISPECIES: hemerythrin domain-containing protein [Litoribacter]MBS9524489.1 hemerythrin domain-containing protein [Litoribacter alkaliphilus]MBT0810341.1 hemerythrin domain-containing protein [Litoribacter ruber]
MKRHTALVPLSQDHHFGLLLSWKIRKGLKVGFEKERIVRYVEYYFGEHLSTHFELEERHIFPFLDENHPMRTLAEKQHRELRALVEEINDFPKGKGEELETFAEKLEQHIRFEERELFEHIQQVTPEDKMEELEDKLAYIHRKVDDTWTDRFWE